MSEFDKEQFLEWWESRAYDDEDREMKKAAWCAWKAALAQSANQGGVPEDRKAFWQKLTAFVDDYVNGYEFRGDEGDYTPNEREQFLIEDCIAGLLSDLDQDGYFTTSPNKPEQEGA